MNCDLTYLYGSLYLYSDQMLLEEYTIIMPNIIRIHVDINSTLSIFFIIITYINIFKKSNILLYYFFLTFFLLNILLINITNIKNNKITIIVIIFRGISWIV